MNSCSITHLVQETLDISVKINDEIFQIDPDNYYDLSIPLRFNGAQPNAYGADRAVSSAVEAGTLVGDTRRGGSCNFESYTFIPHCNGTHTESIGHITNERISVLDSLRDVFIPAMVISVEPENALESGESYSVDLQETDRMITKRDIEGSFLYSKFESPDLIKPKALIVKTLPNDEAKKTRQYNNENQPPFFSHEAMEYIVEKEIEHLLVDIPSIDRMDDDGKLSNHRIFWNVEQGSYEINRDSRIHCTITEMIYVPNFEESWQYLLNLQIAPFVADAAPCRPVIFKLSL